MLLFRCRNAFALYFTLTVLQWMNDWHVLASAEQSHSKSALVEQVLALLRKLETSENLSKDTKFGALLGEFLIKQKSRFYEASRYEDQLYYHLLQKLSAIIRKTEDADLSEDVKRILDNVFQRDTLLLIKPALKRGHIDTHLEYRSLLPDYDALLTTHGGYPNMTMSDSCLADLATLRNCDALRPDCLSIITTDLPMYGYERMHQILLLYVLMHHKCSLHLGSRAAYDISASQRCTQVYREVQLIRDRATPLPLRDLYLEQIVICGLFGYVEFLNWGELDVFSVWHNIAGCYCQPDGPPAGRMDCSCSNHMNSLALVYYINALLLLLA